MINKIQLFVILSIILIIAASLRLYQLSNNYNYYGDSARDLLEIRNWFTSGQIPLKGPLTSMGTFHLGPFYYYLIAPFVFIFRNDPIGPVYFEVIDSLLLVTIGFLFLYKSVNFSTAFIFSFLITLSPLAILLSRGSWNPHPQFLVTLLLVFSFIQFVKTNSLRFIFISAFLTGIGIQLHYTFLANFFSLILLILLFKRNRLNYKLWLLFILGFFLPLLPFFVGQALNNFIDVRLAIDFINQSDSGNRHFVFKTIQDRITYPFVVLFPTDNLFWLFRLLVFPFYLFIFVNAILISVSKTYLSLPTRIVLILFISNIIQFTLVGVPFYGPYHYSAAILALLLICIYLSYLYHFVRFKFVWLPFFTIFMLWEIFLIPNSYKTPRTPEVVYKSSEIIIDDYRSRPKDPMVGIFIISPITLSSGFEYRYLLENEGIKTFSSSRPATADYVIIEGLGSNQTNLQIRESSRRIELMKELRFDYGGEQVNFTKIYKIERINRI
ncbi:hypothetical protein A3D83_02175 [Candidatus Daviesbacteria bacterium RIFCSPHIGHO2_02_FULL_41_10]|uniref:Glycosyltransferase RgtA/B/C/D-like domain-containing protein n=2 Tax=Candidatus Daviesiibacteriota TaxID=1752718 RepID=A0A1F5ITK6_9BACT|nr:MAG: hypothetical protein A2871_03335 [Candidatus Daviesbacteria bacterium RIFCSPHIGHO2_01_FULL_41_23]OGE32436.1 MAG: hypothetical protein A3D83_02175 [Candidatus Daviesbacteria bacterium RIFCSPHIGHO2_02_FULL_41_10]OGE61956.1 MAG: hypothetical protein A2967_03150 [Candidatus Daviesbacteria bacterium RIFCSPLOWO2_01_FULL_41_32]